LDRLVISLHKEKGIQIKRSRLDELLLTEGLTLAQRRTLVWRASRSRLRQTKGVITTLSTHSPPESGVLCLDEMGPEAGKSFPGQQLVKARPERGRPAKRAKQEIDSDRREKEDIFGAFRPATGEAFTRPYLSRSLINWIDCLEQVETWVPAQVEQVYVVLENLTMHRATDVLLFSLAHPRWEFVFQPKDAASLNLIEPGWKTLRSLALKGKRFENWQEIADAVEQATAYWNAHRHPFVWGRRRRHRPRRQPGIALVANIR
jgi:hypothetical protein